MGLAKMSCASGWSWWLEAEGARRSAATIGSITAAATASSSESSISTRT